MPNMIEVSHYKRFLVNLREAPATVFSNVSDMVLESEVTSSRY
mgnify:CR=1 FL=1